MYPVVGASGGAIFRPCDKIPKTLVSLVPWNKSIFDGSPFLFDSSLQKKKTTQLILSLEKTPDQFKTRPKTEFVWPNCRVVFGSKITLSQRV